MSTPETHDERIFPFAVANEGSYAVYPIESRTRHGKVGDMLPGTWMFVEPGTVVTDVYSGQTTVDRGDLIPDDQKKALRKGPAVLRVPEDGKPQNNGFIVDLRKWKPMIIERFNDTGAIPPNIVRRRNPAPALAILSTYLETGETIYSGPAELQEMAGDFIKEVDEALHGDVMLRAHDVAKWLGTRGLAAASRARKFLH